MSDRAADLTTLTVRWETFHNDEGVFVHEFMVGRHGLVRYGPLPPGYTPEEFIAGQKDFYAKTVKAMGEQLALRTINFLRE